MAAPWDPKLASQAAVADQCMKLGAVVITPPPPAAGFGPPK